MDIVERLRREEDDLDNEAADEIERLREEKKVIATHGLKQIAEIERLREALKYYAEKKEEDWKNGDDGVVARAALKGDE